MSAPHRSMPAQLRLDIAGTDRIILVAAGDLTSASFDYVASRLARLATGAPARVQVDCSRVTSMVPAIADLFAQAAATLASEGSSLELSGVSARLGVADRLAAGGHLTLSDVDGAPTVLGGVIGVEETARTRIDGTGPSSELESTRRVAS